jgi:hypothetical protein
MTENVKSECDGVKNRQKIYVIFRIISELLVFISNFCSVVGTFYYMPKNAFFHTKGGVSVLVSVSVFCAQL